MNYAELPSDQQIQIINELFIIYTDFSYVQSYSKFMIIT